jgi:hypothetical protein
VQRSIVPITFRMAQEHPRLHMQSSLFPSSVFPQTGLMQHWAFMSLVFC